MNHYFPNLNGIRCLAAFAVIIHHTEQIKGWLGLKSYWYKPYIMVLGGAGVLLFFVLSGFLITYLLLEEKQQTDTISIKDFYIKRILRIWPLYYFIVFLGFFVYPNIHFFDIPIWKKFTYVDYKLKLFLFACFLPNVVQRFFPGGYFASIAWTVGVEEQFYIIWPHFIKKVQNVPVFLITFIIVYILISLLMSFINKFFNLNIINFINFYRVLSIDCMAIGGLFAYLYFTKNKILKFFYKKTVQIFTLVILFILMFFNLNLHFITNEFYSFLFGILILNVATNEQTIISLENKIFNYLGKISYGLYMYHFAIVLAVLKLLMYEHITNIFLQYTLIILLVIAVASLSFYYFESYFLKLKKRF